MKALYASFNIELFITYYAQVRTKLLFINLLFAYNLNTGNQYRYKVLSMLLPARTVMTETNT